MGNIVQAMTPSEVPNRHSILLKTKAEKLIRRHGSMEPVDLLRVMIDVEFASRIAVVTSFGAESAVLLHLVSLGVQLETFSHNLILSASEYMYLNLSYYFAESGGNPYLLDTNDVNFSQFIVFNSGIIFLLKFVKIFLGPTSI